MRRLSPRPGQHAPDRRRWRRGGCGDRHAGQGERPFGHAGRDAYDVLPRPDRHRSQRPRWRRWARRSSSARRPFPALLPRLARVLSDAHMGTQFYLAGTEGPDRSGRTRDHEHRLSALPPIQKEHRGSTVRRVQCVHCKGITENVATDPFKCSHCGLNLFVRDHYSRRMAAFQGVNIDAEDPGQVPASRGEVQMSGGAKLQVRVAEVVEVNELITRFRFVARDGVAAARLFRRRAYRGRDGRPRHAPAEPLFADVRSRGSVGL